jgi:hypothetical protein
MERDAILGIGEVMFMVARLSAWTRSVDSFMGLPPGRF